MTRKELTPEQALARLEALCARSEHCEWELLTKLRSWGIGEAYAQAIIRRLRQGRFVDDSRFAAAFVNDKWRFAGHGRIKIRISLQAKKIPTDIIDAALEEINAEEYRLRLDEILRAKARTIADLDTYEGRNRLYRAGLSRGFEPPLVAEVMKEILRGQK